MQTANGREMTGRRRGGARGLAAAAAGSGRGASAGAASLRRLLGCAALLAALGCAALLAALGCAAPPAGEGQLAISWSFADGRSCDTAGVALVFVDAGPELEFVAPCAAGALTLGLLPAGEVSLSVEGRSPGAAPLYAEDLQLTLGDGEAREVAVSLRFVGGVH